MLYLYLIRLIQYARSSDLERVQMWETTRRKVLVFGERDGDIFLRFYVLRLKDFIFLAIDHLTLTWMTSFMIGSPWAQHYISFLEMSINVIPTPSKEIIFVEPRKIIDFSSLHERTLD